MDRRDFLKRGVVATAAFTTLGSSAWQRAFGDHPPPILGAGPYGPLGAADGNGLRLPAGFTARVIARTGEPVPGTPYPWHYGPDGAATFATGDGGWIYVCNSEAPVPFGGVSAIRFRPDGSVDGPTAAYRILGGGAASTVPAVRPRGGRGSRAKSTSRGSRGSATLRGSRPASRGLLSERSPMKQQQSILYSATCI